MTPFESAPLSSFHRRVILGGGLGQFADAFSVGVIGIALNLAREPLGLSSWTMGALAAAALAGVVVGSLVTGGLADRVGRRMTFQWSMLIFTVIAAMQYQSSTAIELFALRFALGMLNGADYVVGKALVSEYSPVKHRGQILTLLSIAWAAGFAAAYIVGYILRDSGPEAWRLILLASAVPPIIAFAWRIGIPESAVWLTRSGQLDKARTIITKHLGPNIALPVVPSTETAALSPPLRDQSFKRNVAVGCVLQGSLVIPFYALATFMPMVMSELGVPDNYTGSLIFNVLNLFGAILGIIVVDRIFRRTLIVRGFLLMSLFLGVLIVWREPPPSVIVAIFAAFALVIATTGNLQFVYPPELFSTELRARGIGAIVATSRVGSASSTFLLPVIVENYGIYAALSACLAITVFAAAFCYRFAPETLHKRLG